MESQLRKRLYQSGLWGIFLIDGWWERAQPTVVRNTPGQAVPECSHGELSKPRGEQAREQPSSVTSRSVLHPGSFLAMDCKL